MVSKNIVNIYILVGIVDMIFNIYELYIISVIGLFIMYGFVR